MPFSPQTARTRVRWHHKALTASFADASPAMIWRWNRDELPAGFVLRAENGQMHLRQSDAEGAESTLAIFSSATAAERALTLLSKNLLGGSIFLQALVTLLAGLGAVLLGLVAYIYWHQYHMQAIAVRNGPTPMQARSAGAAPIPVAPAGAPAPTTPVPGTPVDVDQIYK